MDISLTQYGIMIATVALVIGYGNYSSRSVHSAEGYTLGGRKASAPLVAGSIAGGCIGGGATVGSAQMASVVGLSGWWFTLGAGISFIIMALFYAKPLRKTSLETIPQYLSLHYGEPVGVAASLISSAGILFSAVASSLPGVQILSLMFGISSSEAAVLLLLLVTLYGFFGGMKSAGTGGILKMVVIWSSLFLAGYSAFREILINPGVAATMTDFPWYSLFGIGVADAGSNLFALIVGILCTQTYIQAVFSASDPETASYGAWLAALIVIPVGLPCVAIGMYMHAAHPEISSILVLPVYLLKYQPVLLGSVAMGGILLSLISSITGLSLGIGTILSRDVFARVLPKTGAKGELLRTRLVVLAVVMLAAYISIRNEGSQVLFWNFLSMALRGGGIFIPLTLAIFRPQAVSSHCALLSIIISVGLSVLAFFCRWPLTPLFLGLGISMLILIAGFVVKKRERK